MDSILERAVLRECFRCDSGIPFPFGESAQPIEEASALVIRQALSGPSALTGISTKSKFLRLVLCQSDHPARRYIFCCNENDVALVFFCLFSPFSRLSLSLSLSFAHEIAS